MTAFYVIFGFLLYFTPSIVAFARGIENKVSVLVINFFTGWTLVGWVVALAMATKTHRTPTVVNVVQNNENKIGS